MARTATPPPRSAEALAAALLDARNYTLGTYAHLTDAEQRFPLLAVVNPALWEIGHVGWFQEFWCRRHRPDDPRGVRTPSRIAGADALWDSSAVPHATRWSLPLPDAAAIDAYLAATLADTLAALAASGDDDRYFFELALLHEDMHGEALLMTLQTLGLRAPPGRDVAPMTGDADADAASADVSCSGGIFELGAPRRDVARRFVFDNEKWAHPVDVAPFALARRCVNHAEFAAFVDAGGYTLPALWSGAGEAWRAGAGRAHPAYWRPAAGGWEVRRFAAWEPLDPRAPVRHVNAFEAEAWCRWAGRRLPTEAEWECAALAGLAQDAADAPATGGSANSRGRVWEWTSSPFAPYPGFVPDPYADYSAPWFGDHRVLRGGSWATRSRLIHPRFRNFYRPGRHDPFAGFRSCAAD